MIVAGAGRAELGWPEVSADAGDAAQSERPEWIGVEPGHPYFVTETGRPWTPIGQNDAVTWPELAGLFRRRDLPGVERHLRWLKAHGVTCLRLMLEYCHGEHRYIERPAGRFAPNMVRLWDDLFALLERVGLHVLLTPFDTFFTWERWRHHPYNRQNGGPCASRRQLLTCPAARAAIKQRLAFASDRWGASPALFAWDLWNEMHPAHGGDDPAVFAPFIDDVGPWLRQRELERHGRAHLQTVSVFGPELIRHPEIAEPIFRHPQLDFANTHLYETGTIDDPRDTVAPALAAGRLVRAAVQDARDGRPVFDSEHGPIHRFKDKKHTLAEPFDDEYFRHMQWAHLAGGGAGGGMRWPNRHPHVLTAGMRRAQKVLADFLPAIDWTRFRRRNLNEELGVSGAGIARFGCGDERQAVVWLLRTDTITRAGTLAADAAPAAVDLVVPGLLPGRYRVRQYNTVSGQVTGEAIGAAQGDGLRIPALGVRTDLLLAITRAPETIPQ
jgi:mannan endo-1,4-beta-mannosidase